MVITTAGYDLYPETTQVVFSILQAQRCPMDRVSSSEVVIAHPLILFYVQTGANSSIYLLDTSVQRTLLDTFISIEPTTLVPIVRTNLH